MALDAGPGRRARAGDAGLFRQVPGEAGLRAQRAAGLRLRQRQAEGLHPDGRRPDAGRQRPLQARARDDRGGRQLGQPLPLLPDLARGGRAPARQGPGAGRADRRRTIAPPTCRRARRRCSTSPCKLTEAPDKIEEADREELRKAGFSDRDIWDIAAVAAFYNMSNRLAAAADMRPNREYHYMVRERTGPEAPPQRPPPAAPGRPSRPMRGGAGQRAE